MNPEEVERLLRRVEPDPPPDRVEKSILARGKEVLRRRLRLREFAGVAAAGLILCFVLWRIFVPAPGDPGCRGAVELETHLDATAAVAPPAFPTRGPDLEAYVPLFRRADAVKPLAEELRWQQIPWVLDFEEAQRLARAERRPLFVWVSSHDPLERCCGCAAGLRAGPLSREEVVRRVSAGFVPVALDRESIGKEILRSFQRQKSMYHGIWIVSPEGKVLGAFEGQHEQDLLRTMDAGLKAFGPVTPRAVEPKDLQPERGLGARADGSVSLALTSRLMRRGARDGPVVVDSLTLTAAEWALLVPTSLTVGAETTVPEAVARKFCRVVSPVSDPEFTPRPDQAKTAELRATVASVDGGTATIRLSGRWETEHSTTGGKAIRASASGEGVAVFDLQKKSMRSLLLVTSGVWGLVPEAREAGSVVEWTAANR